MIEDIRNLKVDDVVHFTDEPSIENAIRDGKEGALDGVHRSVESITNITENNNVCDWKVIVFKDKTALFVQIVDDAIDLKLMETPDWFRKGTRTEQLDEENHFLFKEPEDIDDFKANELEMADSFNLDFGEETVEYKPIGHSFYGRNDETQFVCVTEYASTVDAEIPNIVVLETGGEANENGGWMEFLGGYKINENDVEIFSQ